MSVPTAITDLNVTAASNSPGGTDVIGTTMDDFIRAHASFIAQLYANDPTKAGLQVQLYTAFTTGGSSTAYTLTPTPAIGANTTNFRFRVNFHTAAGATPTLAVSGQTAKSLKYTDSSGAKQAVTSTQIPTGWISDVEYDGTDWMVLNPVTYTGKLVQALETTPITSVVTCSTTMPYDDTIPQNTEGTEVITKAITPTNASNRLRIERDIPLVSAGAAGNISAALFQDTTAGALAAASVYVSYTGSGECATLTLVHEMAAGTTSATTFKIRVGHSSGTAYVNGDGAAGARRFGGVSAARLRVTEIA